MRLAPTTAFAAIADEFESRRAGLTGYRVELLNDPVGGWCLRNYIALTEFPELLADLRLTEADLYWNRYYWLFRYARVWRAADPGGYDPAIEDQLTNMLEYAPWDEAWPLTEIIAAAERDAARQLRGAGVSYGGQAEHSAEADRPHE